MALIIDLSYLFLMISNYRAFIRQTNQHPFKPVDVSSATPEGAALQALNQTYGTTYFNLTKMPSSPMTFSYQIDEGFANSHVVSYAEQLKNLNKGTIQLLKQS